MFPRTILALVAIAALAQDQPTFRAGARLVEMNVIVRNGKGPVAGLTKDDFTIQDQGKPRTISLFSMTSSTPAARAAQHAVPLPAGAVSNRFNSRGETEPSATILLIDRLNTPLNDQRYANQKVVQFLQKHGNGDRLAIYVLGQGVKVLQDLTDDPERLERAVKNLKPQDARSITSDNVDASTSSDTMGDFLTELQNFERLNKVTTTRDALKAIAQHVSKVPGRKNLIWISASFPIMVVQQHQVVYYDKEVDEAARALSDANVAMYSVDARGLAPSGYGASAETPAGNLSRTGPVIRLAGLPTGLDTMNRFASLTGGLAFYNSNGIDDSIQKATEDAEVSYNLGFYVPEEEFNGLFHKLTVKVKQKGMGVRSRNGYFASKAPALSNSSRSLPELLKDPLEAMGVGLMAQVTRDPAGPQVYNLHARVTLQDIHLDLQDGLWIGSVKLATHFDGAPLARTIVRKVEIPEAQLAAALEKGIEIDDSIKAEGKATGLRVVVQDGVTGAAGSVRLALDKAAQQTR